MTKPPAKKSSQENYVKSALRLPPELHAEVSAAAQLNDRSLNAEIISRLRGNPVDALSKETAELKAMIREVLDIVRDKL